LPGDVNRATEGHEAGNWQSRGPDLPRPYPRKNPCGSLSFSPPSRPSIQDLKPTMSRVQQPSMRRTALLVLLVALCAAGGRRVTAAASTNGLLASAEQACAAMPGGWQLLTNSSIPEVVICGPHFVCTVCMVSRAGRGWWSHPRPHTRPVSPCGWPCQTLPHPCTHSMPHARHHTLSFACAHPPLGLVPTRSPPQSFMPSPTRACKWAGPATPRPHWTAWAARWWGGWPACTALLCSACCWLGWHQALGSSTCPNYTVADAASPLTCRIGRQAHMHARARLLTA